MAEIVGMSRTPGATTQNGRIAILAFFDLRLPGVLMKGCALVRHANGQVTCWPPRLGKDKRREVIFTGGDLKRDVTDSAVQTFYAVGGTDEELHPSAGC